MNHSLKVVLLSFVIFCSCRRPAKISGHWRRLDIAEKQLSTGSDKQFGDLILAEDSTFIMVGNDSLPPSNIPGWHSGGTMKGNWNLKGKFLYFYISDVRLPLTYTVRLLTESDLRFQSNFANSPIIEYKRVD